MEPPATIDATQRSFSMRVSLALLAAVILVGLVFVLDTESWYLLWKALHVLSAVT